MPQTAAAEEIDTDAGVLPTAADAGGGSQTSGASNEVNTGMDMGMDMGMDILPSHLRALSIVRHLDLLGAAQQQVDELGYRQLVHRVPGMQRRCNGDVTVV